MKQSIKNEINNLIKELKLNCSVKEFADRVDWCRISKYQKLSEEFIAKHADRVNWYYISEHQKLSEEFIAKHADRVNWYCISIHQKLSEEFIVKHVDKVNIKIYKAVNENKTLAKKTYDKTRRSN